MPELAGNKVGLIGYGLMGLSWRPQPPPLEDAIATMKAALEAGCSLWVGGEFYGTPEYNSMTILKAYFTKYPEDADKVTLLMKGANNLTTGAADGSPEGIRRSLDNIISQLGGTKKLDLFNCARRDKKVPFEVTLGTLQKEYVDTGKLGAIALSECSVETIHEAVKHVKIAAVEVEVSLFTPDILTNGVGTTCAKYGIPIIGYSPIGRGMLTGAIRSVEQTKNLGVASSFPRFQAEAIEHNLKFADQVVAFAQKKGCAPSQLAIAWAQKLSNRPGLPTLIPIPGGSSVSRVKENSKLVELSEDEFKSLSDLAKDFKIAGDRYPDFVPMNT